MAGLNDHLLWLILCLCCLGVPIAVVLGPIVQAFVSLVVCRYSDSFCRRACGQPCCLEQTRLPITLGSRFRMLRARTK